MNVHEGEGSQERRPLADGERQVRDLLQEAGQRPAVPAQDLASITAAARAAWCDLVAARRLRRARGRLALAAGVLAALFVGWWWATQRVARAPQVVAGVERVVGEARVEMGRARVEEMRAGDRLPAGATLETGDGLGRAVAGAALRLSGGASLRLDSDTRVRLVSAQRLELERGAVYLDSGPATAAGAAVEVGTPFGVVRDVGTQFEVRLAEAQGVRVRVRQGRVSVDGDGAIHSAVGGEELRVARDGSVVRGTVASHGPEWDWIRAAAPGFDIEGRSLAAYLEWIGREEGWRVRYQSPELEASAATIRLHGTIAGLTPEESVSVVLPGSGLAYRLEGGILLVTRRQNS